MFMVAVLVGLVFAPASTVMAASATRSMLSSVDAGAEFDVSISADYGAFGQVVETLPAGFSYVSSTLSEAAVDTVGQEVTFTLLAEDTDFSYTVAASSIAGTYSFGGTLKDENKDEYTLGGQAEIIVPATRSMLSSVTAGANFNVDINTFDFGAFGQVVETLPAGFSYVSSTLSEAAVDTVGQEVTFTLLAEDTTFSYTVKASNSTGPHTFSGILKDADKVPYDVGGQTQITVTRVPTDGDGDGVGIPRVYLETNLFGIEARFETNSDGKIQETIVATSEDSMLTMTIPEGTIALDIEGERLETLEAAVDESPPDPPEDAHIIGLAYDFGPDGATFDPPLTLTYTYDPEALPDVADLFLAYYDEATSGWVELPCTVDPVTHTITASVAHFTTFAIIGWVPPVPPPPPVPAAFSVTNLSVTPLEVEPGETVTIIVLVANTGGEAGSYQVNLVINDLVEATKEVTVRAGLSKEVTFSVTREEAGSYTVTVDGQSGSFTVAPVVVLPEPAAFSVSYLSFSPLEVEPGEAVTITVLVANTGGESGSYTVVLKIDGVKEAEETVTLAAGESQDVSFSATREEPGNYTVTVDGWSGSFTVLLLVEPPGINWALIGGIIGGVVIVAGLLYYFLVFRRRAY